jgi:hypothetical protein
MKNIYAVAVIALIVATVAPIEPGSVAYASGPDHVNETSTWVYTHPVTGADRVKVTIAQQDAGDRNPGAGILCVESGDDNGGNGFREVCLTHRSNTATVRTSGRNGDQVEFELSDGNANTPAILSVKGGDGGDGAFIQARDRRDSLGNAISAEYDGHPFVGIVGTHTGLVPVIAYHIRNTQPDSDIAFTFDDNGSDVQGELIDRLYMENNGNLILSAGTSAADPDTARDNAALTIIENGADLFIDLVSERANQDVRFCFRYFESNFCRGQIFYSHGDDVMKLIVGSLVVAEFTQTSVTLTRPLQLPVYTETTLPSCNAELRGAQIVFEPSSGADQVQVCMKDSNGTLRWHYGDVPLPLSGVQSEAVGTEDEFIFSHHRR